MIIGISVGLHISYVHKNIAFIEMITKTFTIDCNINDHESKSSCLYLILHAVTFIHIKPIRGNSFSPL